MRTKVCLGVTIILMFLACKGAVVEPANTANNQQNETALTSTENNPTDRNPHGDIWMPPAIKECMSKTNVQEPFELATFFNPFYLRADFDGNQLVDYAVLIKGKETKRNGLVICKDSTEPFVFGSVSKSGTQLSTFENDNFVTDQWDINTKKETKRAALNSRGESEIGSKAKGESIGFYFDGGAIFIYWDGKAFKIAEGG